jgi:predicted kinase
MSPTRSGERAGHELSVTSGWPCSMLFADRSQGLWSSWVGLVQARARLASALGRELGWDIFSSDQARKELAGLPLYTRGGPAVRRRLYSKATTRKTYAALLRNARNQVKERRSLILDATFSLRHYRDQLRQQLDRAGVAYCFVEAQASEKTSRKRLEARERKAHEVSDARLEDFEMLNRSYESPLELDLQHRITVGTEHSLEATVAETLKALTECKG